MQTQKIMTAPTQKNIGDNVGIVIYHDNIISLLIENGSMFQ